MHKTQQVRNEVSATHEYNHTSISIYSCRSKQQLVDLPYHYTVQPRDYVYSAMHTAKNFKVTYIQCSHHNTIKQL